MRNQNNNNNKNTLPLCKMVEVIFFCFHYFPCKQRAQHDTQHHTFWDRLWLLNQLGEIKFYLLKIQVIQVNNKHASPLKMHVCTLFIKGWIIWDPESLLFKLLETDTVSVRLWEEGTSFTPLAARQSKIIKPTHCKACMLI